MFFFSTKDGNLQIITRYGLFLKSRILRHNIIIYYIVRDKFYSHLANIILRSRIDDIETLKRLLPKYNNGNNG